MNVDEEYEDDDYGSYGSSYGKLLSVISLTVPTNELPQDLTMVCLPLWRSNTCSRETRAVTLQTSQTS